jgi:methyl-accepting chemotaxis protein
MNKKIGVKIGGMLGILIIICLLSNIISIFSMRSMNKASQELSEKYVISVNAIANICIDIDKEQKFINLLTNASNSDMNDSMVEKITELRESIKTQISDIDSINKTINDPTVTKLFSEFITAYNNYEASAEEILSSYGKNQNISDNVNSNMISQINTMDESLSSMRVQYSTLAENAQAHQSERFEVGYAAITLMTILGVSIALIIILTTMITVVNPAKRAKLEIEHLVHDINNNKGDLTKRIHIKTKDEIGEIVKGVNNLIECLQEILKSIKLESEHLQGAVQQIESKVSESDANINDVSSTTEELAASMEEVTSTILQLNENASSILEAAEMMNERAVEGSTMAKNIKKSAETMNHNAENSKALTDKTVNEIYAGLQAALDNSKSVNKINELTGQILDISSQTNLLALNASIEAARAGEAGKGFAVVADEIRVLADNSRDTANNIQEISQMVISAVEQLTNNSETMVEFVSVNVLSDYEDFVKSTLEYKRDADNINSIINEFAISSGELKQTMQAMNDALDGIAVTVDESTQGVTNVANNANGLVQAMSTILDQLDNNRKIADRLKEETQRFINI